MLTFRGSIVVLLVLLLALTGCSRSGTSTQPSGSGSAPASTAAAPGSTSPTASAPQTGPPSVPPSPETTVNVNPGSTIIAGMKASGQLAKMAELCDLAGLSPAINGKSKKTLLVPTNAAFTALPAGMLTKLREPANRAKLQQLLRYHLISGAVPTSQMVTIRRLMTYEGGVIKVSTQGSDVVLDGKAKIVQPDVKAANGYIDVIDTVLIPPGFKL